MLATARASLLLADPPIAYTLRSLRDEVPSLREVVSIAELPEAGELTCGAVSDDQVVFLQFTSGSTSAPRGVRVTHGSLWANAHAIMVDGLRASSEDRGTISFAPNFGYALTARRTPSTDGLDLSAMRVLGCGAEPIQPDAINSFFERFGEAGLKRSAFLSCYGLAETTLAVTFAGMEDERQAPAVGDSGSVSRRHAGLGASPHGCVGGCLSELRGGMRYEYYDEARLHDCCGGRI
jgi:fatty-acyl-CoA synthase